jgi:hypothetical protein
MSLKLLLWAFLLMPVMIFPLACGGGNSSTSASGGSSNGGNTATAANTSTVTNTTTPVITATATVTNSATKTQTVTATNTATVTNTMTKTNTQTATNTVTVTATKTWTPCLTPELIGDTNTSTTNSASPQGGGYGYFSNFATTATGNLRDIRIYMSTSDVNMQVAIYNTSSGSPTTPLAASAITDVNTSNAYQWVYFYFPSTPALSTSTTYSLCALMNSGSNAPTFAEDSGTNFYFLQSSDLSGSVGSVVGPYSGKLEIVADYCH